MTKVRIGILVEGDGERLAGTVAAVQATVPGGSEIIVLVDGLDAATERALAALPHLPRSASAAPEGRPACFNRLVRDLGAAVFVLLENGVRPGPGWLERLLEALESDPKNGLAGPSTNRAWNEQALFPGAGLGEGEVARAAAEAARRFGPAMRTLEPLYSLGDFCYAVQRSVVAAIGAADEAYGRGPCWEMDYNIRAARAGFRGLWAQGAYVARALLGERRRRDEQARFAASRQHYQDRFCALKLSGERAGYHAHCRGDACRHFAPAPLITLPRPLAPAASVVPPAPGAAAAVVALAPPPLVTCIMPTCDRRRFVPLAIACFRRQDYPNRELVIIDDGSDPVADLVPDAPDIRYLRLPRRQSLGAKRNLACREARGELVAHWDDDDWSAPSRLSYQVRELEAAGADMCGTDRLLFHEPSSGRAWRFTYAGGGRRWLAGGTLCYRKALSLRHPFPEIDVGEDTRFVWAAAGARLCALADADFYVATVHPTNTSPKQTAGPYWSPCDPAVVRVLLGDDYAAHVQAACPPAPDVTSDPPLVSCIMPTADRRTLVPLAIGYFLRQSYPERELIVVDDGIDPVADLIPDDPRLRYLRLPHRTSLGAKRNLACRNARGAVIVHWDDDDWHGPERVAAQVAPLLDDRADVVALGMRHVLALDGPTFWQCRPELHARLHFRDLCPGTIAYRRPLWERHGGYPVVDVAEDVGFLKRLPGSVRILRLDDPEHFVCVRHDRNTWALRLDWQRQPQGWQRIERPAFVSEAELLAYARLGRAAAAGTHGRAGALVSRGAG